MGIQALDAALLNGYLGKNVADFCTFGFTSASENHCAHFVSHVLQFEFGYRCKGEKAGRNIRVKETFEKCPNVGKWENRSPGACLVFVTQAGNVHLKQKIMDNVKKKHIGIFLNGTIWHYKNEMGKVITQTPEEFIKHYPGQTNALFFGAFASEATAISFAESAAVPGN